MPFSYYFLEEIQCCEAMCPHEASQLAVYSAKAVIPLAVAISTSHDGRGSQSQQDCRTHNIKTAYQQRDRALGIAGSKEHLSSRRALPTASQATIRDPIERRSKASGTLDSSCCSIDIDPSVCIPADLAHVAFHHTIAMRFETKRRYGAADQWMRRGVLLRKSQRFFFCCATI